MRTTFTLHNITESALTEIAAMEPRAAYAKLAKWAFGDLRHAVKIKHGTSDAFRDRVDWNTVIKSAMPITMKMEPRRGYKLITFEG